MTLPIINTVLSMHPDYEFTKRPESALQGLVHTKITPDKYHYIRTRLETWYKWAKDQNQEWFYPSATLGMEPHYWFIEIHRSNVEILLQRPLFEHDCGSCKFLGNYQDPENHQISDLYSCTKGPRPTLIARYGNEGHEYRSGASFVGFDLAITEADRRNRNDAHDFIHSY